VSKYYEALKRTSIDAEEVGLRKPRRGTIVAKTQKLPVEVARRTEPLAEDNSYITASISQSKALVPHQVLGALAGQPAIHQLGERIAPRAAVERSCRVAISGCRSGDGASSIAAALALDLSERLSVRTLLVDANLRAPGLHRVIGTGNRRASQLTLDGSLQLRETGSRRLTLATICLEGDDLERDLVIAELETVLRSFPAAIIDLGVSRLDPRMLPLVRPSDPIMLVVRYGQTERHELATTTAALKSAERTVAGVILNARPSHFHTSSGEHSVYERAKRN